MLSVVSVILVCAIIIVIAWLFSRLLGKTWSRAQKGRYLDIIDQAPLGQDRALLIVRIQDKYYLVGSTPQNIQLIAELGDDFDPAAVREDYGSWNGTGGQKGSGTMNFSDALKINLKKLSDNMSHRKDSGKNG
jgi:flagellar protein FliO/FliZ